MKVLYHHRTASRDGQSTHIEEMIAGMRANGHQVEECAPYVGDHDPSGGSAGWVGRLKTLLPRPLYELAELAYSVVAFRRLTRKIASFEPDGIYERYNLYLLAGVWAKKWYGLPYVLEVNAPMAVERRQYGGLSLPWLADWVEQYVWKQADAILPVTQVLADYMVSKGVASSKIHVIPNAINPAHFLQLPTSESAKAGLGLTGKTVVGFTGFVREWDRLDRIVRWIANQSPKHNVHLLVIGDGPARRDIEQCAATLGIADRLSFTGAVPRQQVPALSMSFDIALQTALVPYASPLCLFEYLALCKAIVAPDQPNHHEILKQGVNAILYDPNDQGGVEKALSQLIAEPGLRQRIANSAGNVIHDLQLTWPQHAKRAIDLLSSLSSKAAGRQ